MDLKFSPAAASVIRVRKKVVYTLVDVVVKNKTCISNVIRDSRERCEKHIKKVCV